MQKCDACHKPAWACAECLKEVETPKPTNEPLTLGKEREQ